ncbi:MAG: ankyrin repeat domain-containing protein [Treponema sp.]|nr:ankyrin repeat domain-containing protein [Treponema sp.]
MNWIIISDNKDDSEELKSILNKKYKNSIVYFFTGDEKELRSSFEVISEATHAVVLSVKNSETFQFVSGFLCGHAVPVYLSGKEYENHFEMFPNFLFFKDKKALFSHLNKHADKIIRDDEKRTSFNYLFENGIPFDSDHFAEYLVRDEKKKEKQERNKFILECYLSAGININSRDKDGTPLLNIACRACKLDAVKWLIELGADVNAVSEDRGYTALMDAVWKGNKEIASYLISKGADLNTISKEGQSNLVLAVGADKVEIVKLLAENGADPDVPDAMGMSAYGYAQLFKKEEIAAILEKYHKEQ